MESEEQLYEHFLSWMTTKIRIRITKQLKTGIRDSNSLEKERVEWSSATQAGKSPLFLGNDWMRGRHVPFSAGFRAMFRLHCLRPVSRSKAPKRRGEARLGSNL